MGVTRRLILQKARHQATGKPATPSDCLWARGFRYCFTPHIGVLFTFPSRYSFTIGRQEYLALDGGPPRFPHERPSTWYSGGRSRRSVGFAYGALTLSGLPFQGSSTTDRLGNSAGTLPGPDDRLLQPPPRNGGNLSRWVGFALFPFRSPLLRECSLFLQLLRCFSSLAYLHLAYLIQPGVTGHDPSRVSPFGHLRITVCSRLPEAFRSLPRPSSALGAKASTPCPL